MKIAHTADVHYSMENLEEIDRCFSFVVDKAVEHQVDVAVISGDFVDEYGSSIRIEDEVLDRASESLRRLADHCPVFLLQGTYSHEPPGCLTIFSKLRAKHQIYVSDTIEQVLFADGLFWSGDLVGEPTIVFSALPPVNKARLVAYKSVSPQEANQEIKDVLLDVFRAFGQVNDRYDCPCVFAGHGTVVGAEVSEGQTIVGRDIEFPIQDLRQARCSVYCMGHIHRRQSWKDVLYPGSICPLDFGEEEEKGFNLLTFEGSELVDVNFIKTPYRPRMSFDLGDNPVPESVVGLNGTGAFVRVRYRVDEERRDGLREDEIRKALADAYQVKVEKTIIPKERLRSAGISQVKSLEEKVLRWGETVNVAIPPGVLEKAREIEKDR